MESVLVGIDRSKSSLRAVWYPLERAKTNGWKITIAHVINWSPCTFTTLAEN